MASKARKGREEGFSLLVVLWALAFLMIVATGFAQVMRTETYGTMNFEEQVSVEHLAMAGAQMGMAEIERGYDFVYTDDKGRLWFAARELSGIRTLETARSRPLAGGRVSYSITDERGKINVNTSSRQTLVSLLDAAGLDMTEADVIADSILDWADANHEFHLNGAEDDYYSTLPDPYGAKDAPFDAIEELLLVRGVTPEVFYGPSAGIPGISGYLTVKGDGRININTAPMPVLEAAFGPGAAVEIALRKATEDFHTVGVHGGDVTSNLFRITSRAELGGVRAGVTAVVERDPSTGDVRVLGWSEEGLRGGWSRGRPGREEF